MSDTPLPPIKPPIVMLEPPPNPHLIPLQSPRGDQNCRSSKSYFVYAICVEVMCGFCFNVHLQNAFCMRQRSATATVFVRRGTLSHINRWLLVQSSRLLDNCRGSFSAFLLPNSTIAKASAKSMANYECLRRDIEIVSKRDIGIIETLRYFFAIPETVTK